MKFSNHKYILCQSTDNNEAKEIQNPSRQITDVHGIDHETKPSIRASAGAEDADCKRNIIHKEIYIDVHNFFIKPLQGFLAITLCVRVCVCLLTT